MPVELDSDDQIGGITNVTFYWTHPSPSKFLISKPVIVLDHLMISDTIETAKKTGIFGITKLIPPIANQTIAHNQKIKLLFKYHSQ